MVCAFTGHRPQRLPWGTREEDAACGALKRRLYAAIEQSIADGCSEFLCGMARGSDFYFAEAVLAAKLKYPHVTLEAVVPCPEQAHRWPAADRSRYERILQQCSRVTVLEPCYSDGCMLRRNQRMIDRADRLITAFGGGAGGAASAIAYARKQGVEIIPLWK